MKVGRTPDRDVMAVRTQQEVADELGVSRAYVSQLEVSAMRKLRAQAERLKCGACSEGRHVDCSGWCFCTCEFNR